MPTSAGILATISSDFDRMRIDHGFVLNAGFLPQTFWVWVIPSGGTTATSEASIIANSIGAFGNMALEEIYGMHVEGGGTIRGLASNVNALYLTASGTGYPLGAF